MPTPVRDKMRGARIYLFSFIILSAWFAVQGMAGETLTWEGCVEEALKNNPDLVSAQEKVKQAKADKGITQSAMLPEVSSQLSATTSESSNGQTQDTYSYALRGQQLVFDGFKTVANIGAASKTITAQVQGDEPE